MKIQKSKNEDIIYFDNYKSPAYKLRK